MNEKSNSSVLLAQKIDALVCATPPDLVESVIAKLGSFERENWPLSVSRLLANIHNPYVRSDLMDLFEFWQKELADLPASAVALALQTALFTQTSTHQSEVELVWTGPETHIIPFRRTDQALLQVIHSAQSRLLIVSFAIYKIKAVVDALEQAVACGVEINICLESPEESQGKITFHGEQAFSSQVLEAARLYVWPLEKRHVSTGGDIGALHAKLVVADGKILFISSANLTDSAMHLNMELGVLIQGGDLPAQVEKHFDELILTGVLKRVHL